MYRKMIIHIVFLLAIIFLPTKNAKSDCVTCATAAYGRPFGGCAFPCSAEACGSECKQCVTNYFKKHCNYCYYCNGCEICGSDDSKTRSERHSPKIRGFSEPSMRVRR